MKKLIVALAIVMSSSAMAEPSGSLKTMLDTEISLMEYYQLYIKIESVERLARNQTTVWESKYGKYESVVKLSASFNFSENNITHNLSPVVTTVFDSIAEAKAYSKALIEAEKIFIWLDLMVATSPNGWGNGGTNADGYTDGIISNSKIRVSIPKGAIAEEFPEDEYYLQVIASLDSEGDISGWNFNI